MHHCTVCHGTDTVEIIDVPGVPILCNVLWPDQEEATRVQRVAIQLRFCRTCGHIYNPEFDVNLMDYTQVYENSLHFSPRFQTYAEELARDLVERHDLNNKEIIEIGSGKGDFLEMLCELGNNRGIGFDPSYIPGETGRAKTDQITFVQNFYDETYADQHADFICCRHTLEHIPDPRGFLASLRRTIGNRRETRVFFEVPNALFTLNELAIWDIIYEHCSYFTKYSLAYLFAAAGFRVTDVCETYGGQFLTIDAVPADASTLHEQADWNNPAQLLESVNTFADRYRRKIRQDEERLQQLREDDCTAVIWGAGSKGITFLNILNPGERIQYAVDINPRKQGMYITGTGQLIVPPDKLAEIAPDVIFVMNPIYQDEIRSMLNDIGVTAQLLAV